MSLSLKHVDACVPITALKAFDWDRRNLVFQGQGPFFRIIDESTGDVVTQVRLFRRNNVHGFIVLPQRLHQDGKTQVQVLAWGDRSLRAVDLVLGPEDAVMLSISSAEFLAPDWIMSGCAAVEGQSDTAYFITANNALLSLRVEAQISHSHRKILHLRQLITSVKSILYAADLIAISPWHVLITAGTAFGEIIVWSCFIDNTNTPNPSATGSIHHFFTGHDGSIFGVRISPRIPSLHGGQSGRLLASCSDDRTVRIWDISDCEYKSGRDISAYSTDGFELRSTGFGSAVAGEPGFGSESCVAKAFGHISRIWSVNFRPLKANDSNIMGLVSRGEDGRCVLWDLSWTSQSHGSTDYQLRQTSSLRRHSGKHVWSLDLCTRGTKTNVYTGGADGALRSFTIDEVHASPPTTPNKSVTKTRTSKVGIKAFAFVAPDCFLACSGLNELQIGHVSPDKAADITWETLCVAEDLRSSAVMAGIPAKGMALVGNSHGRIRLYNHGNRSVVDLVESVSRPLELLPVDDYQCTEDDTSQALSFVIAYASEDKTTLLSVTGWNTDCPKTETLSLNLPPASFAVSSACLIQSGRYLMVGSKLGGLALYQVSGKNRSPDPLLVKRRVHGRDGTNAIRVLPAATKIQMPDLEYVMTCGRDGTYCLHEVRTGRDQGDAVSIETIHQTSSALGGNLEGIYIDRVSGDLMTYGFRSQDFVLRNESRHEDIISIASGGARRLWAFNTGTGGDGQALLLWKEGMAVHTHRIRADLCRSVRIGGHGREIKAMDGFHAPPGMRSFFATGAEDTTVRIFAFSSPASAGPWGSFECLGVFDTHISGIQQVTWSEDGQYLFTSAADEELFVWRICWVPTFGIAAIVVASIPKENPDSELRVTSFDVVDVTEPNSERGFLLCMGLSNSLIKIFHFSPTDGNKFTLLAKGQYMTNCLTQVHLLLKDSSLNLITAATDGHVTLWDLTHTLESFYIISSPQLAVKHPFGDGPVYPEMITCENRYQVHSNSIKAMELVLMSNTDTVVLTGGDDNSLSISLLRTSPMAPSSNAHMASVSIPDAHTASVTALALLDQQLVDCSNSSSQALKLIVASSGNDHRIKVWSVDIDPAQPKTQSINVELLLNKYSSVADISAMGLIKGSDDGSAHVDEKKLLVCGVGMEILKLALE